MELLSFIFAQQTVLDRYRDKMEEKLKKFQTTGAWASGDFFHIRVRGVFKHEPERKFEFFHRSNCSESTGPPWFPRDFDPGLRFFWSPWIRILAKRTIRKSPLVREALRLYGGYWWLNLEGFDVSSLEAVAPGTASAISRIAKDPLMWKRLSSYQTNRAISQGTLWADLEFARTQAIFWALLVNINDSLSSCVHPWDSWDTECFVCGRLHFLNAALNARFSLHPQTCDRCSRLITAQEKPAIFYKGISDATQREVFEYSFARLDALTDYHYWRSPFLSKKTTKEIGIGSLPDANAREISQIMASLARKEVVGRLYENPEALIQQSGLSNKFPRGNGRGVRTIASDGHLCLSYGERDICEFLQLHGLAHSREPVYANFVEHGEDFGASRGDFLIGKVIYEYAGLAGNEIYDTKLLAKVTAAREQGLEVRVIKPGDLANLPDIFADHLDTNPPPTKV